MIAKCGEINQWHWAHRIDNTCDSWREHETAWHRDWKNRFPDDWQEVIIEKSDKKHIADVKTLAGLVIEFQNSSISAATIRTRESFYGNLVWVINAKDFAEQLDLGSVVLKRLRRLKQDYTYDRRAVIVEEEEFLKELNAEINAYNAKANKAKKDAENLNKRYSILLKIEEGIDDIAKAVFDGWSNHDSYSNHEIYPALAEVRQSVWPRFDQLVKRQRELKLSVAHLEQQLQNWSMLRNFDYKGRTLKRVKYNQVRFVHYRDVIAIEKKTLHTFFPKVIEFNSAPQLELYAGKENEFEFGIDGAETMEAIRVELQRLGPELNSSACSPAEFITDIREIILAFAKEQMATKAAGLISNTDQLATLSKISRNLAERKVKYKEDIPANRERELKKLEQEERNKHFQIMRELKGQYTFTWKRERKSWQDAQCRLFFDLGDGNLFERTGNNAFQKIAVEDFVGQALTGKLSGCYKENK